jgi:hypothetical protein
MTYLKLLARVAVIVPLLAIGCARRAPGQGVLGQDAPEPAYTVAADYPQPFRTEGNRIIDGQGTPRILRGVAVPEVVWIAERQDSKIGYFDGRMFHAAADWHADVMRLSVMPAVWRKHGQAEVLRVLDRAVAYARHYGLYLIINFHSIGYPPDERTLKLVDWYYGDLYRTDPAEFRAFWQAIARRYAGNPTVAFYELFNEIVPITADGRPADQATGAEYWSRWRDRAEMEIDLIRGIDPAKPIIVGGLQYGYDLSDAPQAPVRRPNIVYATHPYAGSDWRLDWERAFLAPARLLPVMATEFGWDETLHPEASNKAPGRYRETIFQAFDEAGIGWIAWSFSHEFRPSLLRDATSFAPTEFGQVVKDALAARTDRKP